MERIQYLITLPPASVSTADAAFRNTPDRPFVTSDPPDRALGSGGGTAHVLVEAWRSLDGGIPFQTWLDRSPKLVLHGGGQSRRLPSYAAPGKPLLPLPVFGEAWGQTPEQALIDLQLPSCRNILERAGERYRVMVTSGDVLLRYGPLPESLPQADVLAIGMEVGAEQASRFGVFFTDRETGVLRSFLQKPSADRIRELQTRGRFLLDTGVWLLSARAIGLLMERSGWIAGEERFVDGIPRRYEFYAGFGLSLGTEPLNGDTEVGKLSGAVSVLPSTEFHHFGTSREMIESVSALREPVRLPPARSLPVILHSRVEGLSSAGDHAPLWIENSFLPSSWRLSSGHVLTNIPPNDWTVALEPGICLDFVPLDGDRVAIRPYGIDDRFSGPVDDPGTLWMGRPALEWFMDRGLEFPDGETDIQFARIFPALPLEAFTGEFVEWLFARTPRDNERWASFWRSLPRCSADEFRSVARIERIAAQRKTLIAEEFDSFRRDRNTFYRLDLGVAARLADEAGVNLFQETKVSEDSPTHRMHEAMFRAAFLRYRNDPSGEEYEREAFRILRSAIITEAGLAPSAPRCSVAEDQIVWGRSPVRLDLAGGWTDTPPFCIEHGGRVVNLAVNLNGQPPVQVFAKIHSRPRIVVRSIDLGVEQVIGTYEELRTYALPGSEFALAKAALAMAGFLPEFHEGPVPGTLAGFLEKFGGGIEISLLAAVPAGSGLGTSSILGATLLGVLTEFCGLGWSRHEIMARTLGVEQMLTTGGGWQDQAGGVFPGIKLVETVPGLAQRPVFRWLPGNLFALPHANREVLLYYTGITRMAKHILQEIVRGMFLNDRPRLSILQEMRAHALDTAEAIQRNDREELQRRIARSWQLNQALDAGTNPPPVRSILDSLGNLCAGAKLLGAGGGGYMLILARDMEAGDRIRESLTRNPPNPRARFVDLSISDTGLEVTKS